MNQVHKVIWSRVKNCYIVVSEITKRVGRDNKASVTGIRPLRALLCAMVIAGCMLPADADAASGIVWGTGASAPGQDSVAVGTNAKAKKSHAVAQGTEAKAEVFMRWHSGIKYKHWQTMPSLWDIRQKQGPMRLAVWR